MTGKHLPGVWRIPEMAVLHAQRQFPIPERVGSGSHGCRLDGMGYTLIPMKMVHYTLYREDADFVAQCIDYDVSGFGATEEEALANLREAVELYLEDFPEEESPVISQVTVGELAVA